MKLRNIVLQVHLTVILVSISPEKYLKNPFLNIKSYPQKSTHLQTDKMQDSDHMKEIGNAFQKERE